jgi:hypothetical protein
MIMVSGSATCMICQEYFDMFDEDGRPAEHNCTVIKDYMPTVAEVGEAYAIYTSEKRGITHQQALIDFYNWKAEEDYVMSNDARDVEREVAFTRLRNFRKELEKETREGETCTFSRLYIVNDCIRILQGRGPQKQEWIEE